MQNRAEVYIRSGRYNNAIVDYTKAIALNPKYSTAYNGRGNTYFKMGAYDKAITDLNKAIALSPRIATSYSNRGNVPLYM